MVMLMITTTTTTSEPMVTMPMLMVVLGVVVSDVGVSGDGDYCSSSVSGDELMHDEYYDGNHCGDPTSLITSVKK